MGKRFVLNIVSMIIKQTGLSSFDWTAKHSFFLWNGLIFIEDLT